MYNYSADVAYWPASGTSEMGTWLSNSDLTFTVRDCWGT